MDQHERDSNARRHRRRACRAPVRWTIGDEHAGSVVLARDAEGVEGWIVDVGEGGIGLESPVFLPRGCVIRVRGTSTGSEGVLVRVRRVRMTTRTPTYEIGASFEAAADAGLLARLSGDEGGKASPGDGSP